MTYPSKCPFLNPLILAMSFPGRQSHDNLSIAERIAARRSVHLQVHQMQAFHVVVFLADMFFNDIARDYEGIVSIARALDVEPDSKRPRICP